MVKLSRGASGLRHLRWAREIAATLDAHVQQNHLLDPSQKEALTSEVSRLRAHLQVMHEAVKPYRDFLETAHVAMRGKQRVGAFLSGEAQRRAACSGKAPEEEDRKKAAALVHQFDEERTKVEEPRRRVLKAALERAIGTLREGVEQMEARLRGQFDPAFIDSLYPALARGRRVVADEDDEDDDASAADPR
jgi:hypothetical protein